MPYEDPIEAALRSLTDVPWKKRDDSFVARANKTHTTGILQMLSDHQIIADAKVSDARSGRYTITVDAGELPRILKAVNSTGAIAKPHRRKWQS